MNALELRNYLRSVSTENLKLSLMIWGAPGIGKSSIANIVLKEYKYDILEYISTGNFLPKAFSISNICLSFILSPHKT